MVEVVIRHGENLQQVVKEVVFLLLHMVIIHLRYLM